MKTLLRCFSVIPAVLMLLIIFGFSAQDGSASGSLSYQLCYAITDLANRTFSSGLSETEVSSQALSIQLVVRKLAHVTEYLMLTLSIYLPLRVWLPHKGADVTGKRFFYRRILPVFLLSLLCAAADEFHQSFVPGRCGTPADVLVDSVGILIGCILLAFFRHLIINKRNRHNSC